MDFAGATVHDKAPAKAGLAHCDVRGRMKVTAARSFLGVLFGTTAGLIIGWL